MPTPSDIYKICLDVKRERSSGPVVGKPEWIQVVRVRAEKPDDTIIAELYPGEHLSPYDLSQKYGPDIFVSLKRA